MPAGPFVRPARSPILSKPFASLLGAGNGAAGAKYCRPLDRARTDLLAQRNASQRATSVHSASFDALLL